MFVETGIRGRKHCISVWMSDFLMAGIPPAAIQIKACKDGLFELTIREPFASNHLYFITNYNHKAEVA